MSETASFDISATQISATDYSYTITLADTGTTAIGTFWFSWIPGAGYLPNLPTFTAPAGWTARITDGAPPNDGYSIQWVASAGAALQRGQSFDGFTFTSATSPSVLLGDSAIHPGTPADTSFIYSGAPFSDAGVRVSAENTRVRLLDGEIDTYIGGTLASQRMVDANHGFDIHRYGAPGTFEGMAYFSFDNAYTAADIRTTETFFDANSNAVAIVSFTGDDSYAVHVGGVLTRENNTSADGTTEISLFNVQGQSYSSFQGDFGANDVELASSADYANGAGAVNLMGADLRVNAAAADMDLGSAADFLFTLHADETYKFSSAATNDVVTFASGFGAAVIQGFATASTSDIVNISNLFSNFGAAQAAMTTSGGNTIVTDAERDTLTLIGVAPGSLTSAHLGF